MANQEVVNTNELAEYKAEATALSTGIFGDTQAMTFCSFTPSTLKEKALLFNAISNPQESVSDHINEVIRARDLYVEVIEIGDTDKDGAPIVDDYGVQKTVEVPRIIIIAQNGTTYQCVSKGIFNALPRLFSTFGEPTWETPLPLKIKQVKVSKGTMLTFEVDVTAL